MKPAYIFIFSPNNSGTTVMSQYIKAHLRDAYLPPFGNNEGQYAPEVRGIMRVNPWNKDTRYDWNFIKEAWDRLATQSKKELFIEASPPNMMRTKDILSAFSGCSYVFSISSPYSYIASHVYNYAGLLDHYKNQSYESYIRIAAGEWIMKAETQLWNIIHFGGRSKAISYEEFCKSPQKLLEILGINPLENEYNQAIAGKSNSQINKIIDMAPKHLAFLGTRGIILVNEILSDRSDLLEKFGYSLMSLQAVNEILSNNMLLALDGLHRSIQLSQRLGRSNQKLRRVGAKLQSLILRRI